LNKDFKGWAADGSRVVQAARDFLRSQTMHDVKMAGDVLGFVRLNLANKVPSCRGMLRDFWQSVLQVIFTEVVLASPQRSGYGGRRFGFRYGQQMNGLGRAAGL